MIKKVKLPEVATIERAKVGKIEKNVTIIQISATRGQVIFVDEGEIEAKYAVVRAKSNINPKYLYYAILDAVPRFSYNYQTGLNMKVCDLKHMELVLDDDLEIQKKQIKSMEKLERAIKIYETEIEKIKHFKKTMLDELIM